MSLLTSQPPRAKRWTAREYWGLARDGFFDEQRVQLINGRIYEMPMQTHAHAYSQHLVERYLSSAFGDKHWVRDQAPLNLSESSVPDPDIAVSEKPVAFYKDHPTSALLAVEISDTSLALDYEKAGIYAEAGITEYWIVNLIDQTLEVYRKPKRDSKSESGYAYSEKKILKTTDSISPLARPKAKIEVKRFFE